MGPKLDHSECFSGAFFQLLPFCLCLQNCESRKLANSQVPNLVEKVVWKSDADMKRMFEYLVPDLTKSSYILAMNQRLLIIPSPFPF